MAGVKQPLPPFALKTSPNFAEVLNDFNATLLISTFQVNKLIFLSPKDKDFSVQYLKNFNHPMGFFYDQEQEQLHVAARGNIKMFKNERSLAKAYPKKPGYYQSLFLEETSVTTGVVDAHDLVKHKEDLYLVQTLTNQISKINGQDIELFWTPPFIEDNSFGDKCHLNGLCVDHEGPLYASMLAKSNEDQGWRKNLPNSGCIYNVRTNKKVIENLAMPHSPRMYKNQLLVLESAEEQLVRIDIETGTKEVIIKLNGFLRGMQIHGDYAIIGTSKLRKNSSVFNHLPIANKDLKAGVFIVHIPTATNVASCTYENTVDEIFEVALLPDILLPNMVTSINEEFNHISSFGNQKFWRIEDDEK